MNSADVISILEGMAENQEQALDITQVRALFFAVAVIRSLPDNSKKLIDAIFDLTYSRPRM